MLSVVSILHAPTSPPIISISLFHFNFFPLRSIIAVLSFPFLFNFFLFLTFHHVFKFSWQLFFLKILPKSDIENCTQKLYDKYVSEINVCAWNLTDKYNIIQVVLKIILHKLFQKDMYQNYMYSKSCAEKYFSRSC